MVQDIFMVPSIGQDWRIVFVTVLIAIEQYCHVPDLIKITELSETDTEKLLQYYPICGT